MQGYRVADAQVCKVQRRCSCAEVKRCRGVGVQWCRAAELQVQWCGFTRGAGSEVQVQRCTGAQVQRCSGVEVQRCRGAEVQRWWFRGGVAEVMVHRT